MAELRFDKIQPQADEIKKLLNFNIPIIATCRNQKYNDSQRFEILKTAVENGAAYVDIEIESTEEYRKKLTETARKNACKIIISYHNFEETPAIAELKNIVAQAKRHDADLLKIVTTAQNCKDVARILSLYQIEKNIIAFAMGELGKNSRIESFKLGAPFIYAAFEEGSESATGQMTKQQVEKILNDMK
jgi:3-dehydroquinate dehydratase-1